MGVDSVAPLAIRKASKASADGLVTNDVSMSPAQGTKNASCLVRLVVWQLMKNKTFYSSYIGLLFLFFISGAVPRLTKALFLKLWVKRLLTV